MDLSVVAMRVNAAGRAHAHARTVGVRTPKIHRQYGARE
jgi:hypothetical protein